MPVAVLVGEVRRSHLVREVPLEQEVPLEPEVLRTHHPVDLAVAAQNRSLQADHRDRWEVRQSRLQEQAIPQEARQSRPARVLRLEHQVPDQVPHLA